MNAALRKVVMPRAVRLAVAAIALTSLLPSSAIAQTTPEAGVAVARDVGAAGEFEVGPNVDLIPDVATTPEAEATLEAAREADAKTPSKWPHRRFLPAVQRSPVRTVPPTAVPVPPTTSPPAAACGPQAAQSYSDLSVIDRRHATGAGHPDLDIGIRGWERVPAADVSGGAGLVDYGGGTDQKAPQLAGVSPGHFQPGRVTFNALYRVYDWDWATNRRGGLISAWPVTLAVVAVPPGRALHVPDSGYRIGDGFEVLVIFAAPDRVTLQFTRDDNVVRGYTLHVLGACVDPALVAHYQRLDAAGRRRLPALKAGQTFGVGATAGEVGLAVRDTGSFMDPRSRKDWWRGF